MTVAGLDEAEVLLDSNELLAISRAIS